MQPVIFQRAIRCILPKKDRCFWSSPSSTNCLAGNPRGRRTTSDDITGPRLSCASASGPAGDPAGIDVEKFAGFSDLGEGLMGVARDPALRAELCQLIEQRRAPGG